ncbi:ABC-2 transporter permease [Fredinandcohnia humi]
MFNKALWIRNYKQAKFVIWGLWVACLYFTYKFFSHLKNQEYTIAHWDEWEVDGKYEYYFANITEVGIFQVLLVILLASILIGLERTNQSMDFTLSLPYKRTEIFLSKWAIGIVHILAALSVSVVFSIIILINSPIEEYFPISGLGFYYVVTVFVLVGVYTFSLFVGFIGASLFSQFVFSIVFLVFPYGFYNLLFDAISYHAHSLTGTPIYQGMFGLQSVAKFFENLTFPILLLDIEGIINEIFVWRQTSALDILLLLIVPITITAISLYLIHLLSNRLKSENNGKILAYEALLPYLKVGVIVCFYLLGGGMIGNSTNRFDEVPGLLEFHLGGIGFSAVAYFILSKVAGMRLQFGKK